MQKNNIRKISSIFLIISISSAHSSIKPNWRTIASDNAATLYALATAATCIIGKISYDFYEKYRWPNEKIIEHCRKTYATIYKDTQKCYNNYKGDSQASDWDLKEAITHTKKSYPFTSYNEEVVLTLFTLIKHNQTITHELKRISQRKKQLLKSNSKESILFMEEFTQLETKGKSLQKYITRTCTILSALKSRIALFKEYGDDCHNWSCEHEERKDKKS